jgi:mono/diheme cytochrome c family protein
MINKLVILSFIASLPFSSFAQSNGDEIRVPFKFALGKGLYEKNCGGCHGNDGFGVDKKGPPLMHKYYEPSHHGDDAFYRAVMQGTRQHHWNFGDMKPLPDLTQRDVSKIVPYVRWLQQQHGIR